MANNRIVWDDDGDQRKKKSVSSSAPVNENNLELKVRRLTSGKGRTVIEITGLPNNKDWCKALAKSLKQAMGVGGTYKQGYIEIHGEKIEPVTEILDQRSIKWKKTGG